MSHNIKPLGKLVVIGVGLIGGSYALALKQQGLVVRVIGLGRSASNLQQALDLKIIDEIATDFSCVENADLIVLATPVGQMGGTMAQLVPHLAPGTLITDGGSTKQDVVALARQHLGNRVSQFIPAHPVAGAEHSGAAAACADLYQGKRVVLTPIAENTPEAIERISSLWRACGASVSSMSAADHDAIFAAVSHLPHLAAFALVHELASRPNAEALLSFAGAGFRDFTRIASSHPEMWRDICLANRIALSGELAAYREELAQLQVMLDAGDAAAMEKLFTVARNARDSWLKK